MRTLTLGGVTGALAAGAVAAGFYWSAGLAGEVGAAPEGYVGDAGDRVVTDSAGDCVRTSRWSESTPCREVPPLAKAEPVAVTPPPLKRITLSGKTLFDFDKATLRPGGKEALDQAVSRICSDLAAYDVENRRITVIGHTDSIGSGAYNQRLSERRADVVRDYMVSLGVAPAIIDARGVGEADPVASNATPEGQQQNRRVEIEFTATVRAKD
jgi:OOP family OmpA-OmpF porin